MKARVTERDMERLSEQTQSSALCKARYWLSKADLYIGEENGEQALTIASFWLNVFACLKTSEQPDTHE